MTDVLAYSGPRKSVVGVLGGMGPAATADFMSKFIARTNVDTEVDHIPLAIWSNPEVPDRTQFLRGLGVSPVPAMVDGVRRLTGLGADFIAIPCNTAHFFLPELIELTGARFLNMIEETVVQARQQSPGIRRVGILSTRGTRMTGLYAAACAERHLECVELSEEHQERFVDPAINQVKTGGDVNAGVAWIRQAVRVLADMGAEAVIAGCTEIPLIADRAVQVLPVIDATDCLAAAAVDRVQAEVAKPRNFAGP
jgi:aspartate racemase